LHVIFMNYVLAGAGYLAVCAVFGFERSYTDPRPRVTMASVLRDWMPFALGAAITAGVAPLLFIQILYKQSFYTANVLLFHRWMSIVPALIVGFYLLYLIKSRRVETWRPWARTAVGIGPFLCFAFTAYSWTENHMLSMQQDLWPGFYASGELIYRSTGLLPRLAVWFLGSIPTMCVWVAWQLRYAQRHGAFVPANQIRRNMFMGFLGCVLVILAALWYFRIMTGVQREAITSPVAMPFLVTAATGLLVQVVGFIGIGVRANRAAVIGARPLLAASIGVVMTILGATVVRETLRVTVIDSPEWRMTHTRAASVEGLVVFVIFLLLCGALIGRSIRLVMRATQQR